MNDKELQEAFLQFLVEKSGAKTQKELEQYVQNLGKEGLQEAYAEFTQLMQQKTQKARHGAKLNYIKSLKHKCSEDEELVYYKKGGRVDCGCVKKKLDGGKVCPKCGKVHSAKIGCAVAEFKKKFARGGSLNGVPFMLGGKKVPTAPKAEDRYRNGKKTFNTSNYKEVSSASNIFGAPFASKIVMEISNNGNDTTFYETPGRWLPVKTKTRIAKSTNKVYKPIQVSDDGFKSYRVIGIDPEYEILKRRFNTAWNLAK